MIYNAVLKQIAKLNRIREEQHVSSVAQDASNEAATMDATSATNTDSTATKNTRVDTMLVDVFYLLSLFFITVGRSRECPALFSQIGCMKQLLDHLDESAVYTEADLTPFVARIQELREIVRNDERENKHPPQLTKLMSRKLEACQQVTNKLQNALSVISSWVPVAPRCLRGRKCWLACWRAALS